MEGHSKAPWITDPQAWGRVRLTEPMAEAASKALTAYLDALRKVHQEMAKPSESSLAAIREIRAVEHVLENVEGLRREKGWTTTSS